MDPMTDLGRRALGNLPAWAEDEDAVIEEEGGPQLSVRSHSLAEMVGQLVPNVEAMITDTEGVKRPMTEAEVEVTMDALVAEGWAEKVTRTQLTYEDGEDGEPVETPVDVEHYKMTQAGFDALHAPVEEKPDQKPGAVALNLHPATNDAAASGAGIGA
jgi:hypothetical protein